MTICLNDPAKVTTPNKPASIWAIKDFTDDFSVKLMDVRLQSGEVYDFESKKKKPATYVCGLVIEATNLKANPKVDGKYGKYEPGAQDYLLFAIPEDAKGYWRVVADALLNAEKESDQGTFSARIAYQKKHHAISQAFELGAIYNSFTGENEPITETARAQMDKTASGWVKTAEYLIGEDGARHTPDAALALPEQKGSSWGGSKYVDPYTLIADRKQKMIENAGEMVSDVIVDSKSLYSYFANNPEELPVFLGIFNALIK